MWSRIKATIIEFLLDRLNYETKLPEDVQSLLDYMVEVGQGHDCLIYQSGKFPLTFFEDDGMAIGQPIIFRTNEERAAFGAGVHYATNLFGVGSINFVGEENIEYESDEMDKLATHRLRHRMS